MYNEIAKLAGTIQPTDMYSGIRIAARTIPLSTILAVIANEMEAKERHCRERMGMEERAGHSYRAEEYGVYVNWYKSAVQQLDELRSTVRI